MYLIEVIKDEQIEKCITVDFCLLLLFFGGYYTPTNILLY